jgi:hypothetical protein
MRQTKVEIIQEYIKKDGRCIVDDPTSIKEIDYKFLDDPKVGT